MNDRQLVLALKALADSTRFRIVQELAKADELTCNQIVERFSLSQPTISHHLKLLVDADIVEVRVEGKHRWLSLNRALLEDLGASLPPRSDRARKTAAR
jgi:ArsR family transcriptional regulator